MYILQKFSDMGLCNIVNNTCMYIQSDIVKNTDIRNIISIWVHDIYNGKFSLKDCSVSEHNNYYSDESVADVDSIDESLPLLNFTNYYFYVYKNQDISNDDYLENAVEIYLNSGSDNLDEYDEEYINGPFIEINTLWIVC